MTIEGHELPAACGSRNEWNSRLSIRFDGRPRPWTSIDGAMPEGAISR